LRFREEKSHLVAVFFLILTVYLWSAPRTVVLEDDGLFILAAYFNGIAHPPGYPLYTVLGHIMTKLPIDSVAFRVHMLSALFGSLGCVGLWWLVRNLVPGRIYAYTASLAFGFSQVYWSQAIIAEVYTLNVLLFLLLFILALRYSEQPDTGSARLVVLMGSLYGLGLSNHWPLLVLSTPALLAVMWPRWRRLILQLPVGLPFMLLGLLPYVWMVLRSQMDPEISFYGPIESWRDFWFVVSREGYAELDHSPSAGWWDKWQFCGFVLRESVQQLGPVGALFSAIGLIGQWWIWPRRIGVGLLLGYVCNTFLLIGLLGFDYELLHRNIFRVYPLIAYCVLSIWMGLGMYIMTGWLIRRWGRHFRGNVVKVGTCIVVVGMVLLLNMRTNYRAEDDWAEVYAKVVLNTLEPDSVLFTDGDLDMNPLGYFNRIEGVRTDITLYSNKGICFSNRFFFPRRDSHSVRKQKVNEFIIATKRPVYYTYGLPHNFGFESYGLYNRIDLSLRSDRQRSNAAPEIVEYIKKILVLGEPEDPWEIMHYRLLMTDYCRLSLNLLEHSEVSGGSENVLQDWVNRVCHLYHGYLEYAEHLLKYEKPDIEHVTILLEKAESMKDQIVIKSERARFEYLRGELFLYKHEKKAALRSFNESIKQWPHPDNPSAARLYEFTEGD